MGSQIWLRRLCILVCIFSCSFVCICSQTVAGDGSVEGIVSIDGTTSIGKIDKDFICATLDWWPPEKCDYGTCSWDYASLINLDLNSNILLNAIEAFSPLKIRLGGTLQDKVIYDTDDNKESCKQFVKNTSQMFGFTQGCLPMYRWDELNAFFKKAGAKVIFGLNALAGRSIQPDGSAAGAWNYSNAESFISYTVKKNYSIHGWELGNELSGSGVGTRIAANQYAADTISLYKIVQKIYSGSEPKPLIIAPGGFFDANWFKEFIFKTGNSVDVITHHIYNLGPGVDEHLVEKILNPSYLDGEANTFSGLQDTLKSSATSATAWVGEAGGAYNSGRNLVSNAFVYSFWFLVKMTTGSLTAGSYRKTSYQWGKQYCCENLKLSAADLNEVMLHRYLDQLGMASAYDTKTYCRQSLIGGNYGLLNTTTFLPNPDYYSALLWHRLMGRNVLSTKFSGTNKIRAYAHCAKESKGVTLLIINLDNSTTVEVKVAFNSTGTLHHQKKHHKSHRSHKTRTIQVPKGYGRSTREEYHLTAKDGNLHSQTMLLNGNILAVSSSGEIAVLEPLHVNSTKPIMVAPFSVVFVQLSYVVPACS